jgi:Uma2 family endonuclease
MEAIVEQLLQYPQVHLYLEQVQQALREEQVRRQAFYNSLPTNTHAEFINGEIVEKMSNKLDHNQAVKLLLQLISIYVQKHRLGIVGMEKLMVSLTRNDYEPNICFWNADKSQHFDKKQVLFPAPDFIIEVLSDSTGSRDRGIKFQDYAAHGVNEYWLVDCDRMTIEQYLLFSGQYELVMKAGNGIIRSIAISNFEIPIEAIFDEQINFKTLQQIMQG